MNKKQETISIQAFSIEGQDLSRIRFIAPAGVNYNLYLQGRQEFLLSASDKMIYIANICKDGDYDIVRGFQVSKTVFGLGEK